MNFLKQSWFILILFCVNNNFQLQAKQTKELKNLSKEIEQLKAMLQSSLQNNPQPATPTLQVIKPLATVTLEPQAPLSTTEKTTPEVAQTTTKTELQTAQAIKTPTIDIAQTTPTTTQIVKPAEVKPNNKKEPIEEKKENPNSLDFEVKNETGKTIYVCCFYYMKRQDFNRWRWDKTDVQKAETNQTITIKPDPIANSADRKNTYGYLAIFDSEQEAEDSSYELTQDKNKLDIDLLCKLKNKVIKLKAEKYGFKEEKLASEFINKQPKATDGKETPKLDFYVENRAGRPFYLTSFIYEKKPNMPIWQYSKGPIVRIEANDIIQIPVVEVKAEYERIYTRGYLGVFREDEKQEAEDSTFEFLKPSQKMSLGLLVNLKEQKVVLSVEKYGINGDFIDFVTKPIQSPLKNRRM